MVVDYIARVNVDIRKATKSGFLKTARWMEIILDIAVTHPQGADVWQANSNNDWKANQDIPLLCIHINDGSAIGA